MDEFQPQKGDRFSIPYKNGTDVVEVIDVYDEGRRKPRYHVKIIQSSRYPTSVRTSMFMSGIKLTSQRMILNQ